MKKYLTPVLILIICACNPSIVYEKYEELPEETWNRYHVAEFVANIPDSGVYNVKICLRHTTDYEMANLWCFISTRSHSAKQVKDTVNLKIAATDGRWIGTGGSIKSIEQDIHQNPVPLPKGNVVFRIEQGMRFEQMKGIKNIGIKIEKIH